jgi:zinc protease
MKRATHGLAAALTLLVAVAPSAFAKDEVTLPKEMPPYGAERPLQVPEIAAATLANGLTVWLVPRPGFPKVVARVTVLGGTAADPAGMEGMAAAFSEVLKQGTKNRSAQQIAEELQAVGGEIGVGVGDDAINVTVDGLATGLETMLDVLADVTLNPTFPEDEIALAKTNAMQGLLAAESTPEFAVDKAFARAVFGDHPYHTTAPTRETIKAIDRNLLVQEHARRFRPDRALLVVVGATDAKTVMPLAKKLFSGWKATGEAPPATPEAPAAGERRILVLDRPGSVQSQIRVGRPTIPATDADYIPLLVANTIFGGSFTSRLIENIREDKGYTYSPHASAQAYREGGLLEVSAAVRNEVTGATLLEIFYELDRMGATLPTDEELARAKRFQSGLFVLRNQIDGAIAATLSGNWVNGLSRDALADFVPKVNAVSAQQVREVGRRLMTSRTQTVVIGGDAAHVKSDVAQFGTVTMVGGEAPEK